MRPGRPALSSGVRKARGEFGALLHNRRSQLGKSLRATARAIDDNFDPGRLSRIENGKLPAFSKRNFYAMLWALARAYEVAYEVLVLAATKQLTLPPTEAEWQARDYELAQRNEVFRAEVTLNEKKELTRYLDYLRSVADREELKSVLRQ